MCLGVRYVPDTDDEFYEKNENSQDSDDSEDSQTSNTRNDDDDDNKTMPTRVSLSRDNDSDKTIVTTTQVIKTSDSDTDITTVAPVSQPKTALSSDHRSVKRHLTDTGDHSTNQDNHTANTTVTAASSSIRCQDASDGSAMDCVSDSSKVRKLDADSRLPAHDSDAVGKKQVSLRVEDDNSTSNLTTSDINSHGTCNIASLT